MTKADISDKVLILKEYCKGMAKSNAQMSDGEMDYYFGKYDAYNNIAERLEELYIKIKG